MFFVYRTRSPNPTLAAPSGIFVRGLAWAGTLPWAELGQLHILFSVKGNNQQKVNRARVGFKRWTIPLQI